MIKSSDYPNLNAALEACAKTFGAWGGELYLNQQEVRQAAPALYPGGNLSIRGDGANRILPEFAGGDYLVFADLGGGEIRNITLQDFVYDCPANRDGGGSGWAIKFVKGVRSTVRNVDIGLPEAPRHDNGIYFDGFDDVAIDNCKINARWRCLLAHGRKDQSYGADLYIGGGSKFQNYKRADRSDWIKGSALIHFAGGAGGFSIESGDFIFGGIGLLIDTSGAGGSQNREIFVGTSAFFDSCAEDGIRIGPNGCGTFMGTGLWSCSNGTAGGGGVGLRVDYRQVPGMEGQLTGCRIFNNQGDGAAISGGSWVVSGGSYTDNRGWGIGFHNGNASGIVSGANIMRNASKGVRRIVTDAVLLGVNRIG